MRGPWSDMRETEREFYLLPPILSVWGIGYGIFNLQAKSDKLLAALQSAVPAEVENCDTLLRQHPDPVYVALTGLVGCDFPLSCKFEDVSGVMTQQKTVLHIFENQKWVEKVLDPSPIEASPFHLLPTTEIKQAFFGGL
eukprot:Lithocolla_globosa_v1_NODE_1881_length_2277_cov_195.480648.p2 type:complete len:139 gc:universal NODE_1881_length_2277_cov_195.480648:532-948(+)